VDNLAEEGDSLAGDDTSAEEDRSAEVETRTEAADLPDVRTSAALEPTWDEGTGGLKNRGSSIAGAAGMAACP